MALCKVLIELCLCWGLMSQSTIFQSCRDGATASWVINQYFRWVKCLAQGHNTAAVGIEPPTSRSGVRHSTTEPPRSLIELTKQKQLGSPFIMLCLGSIELDRIICEPPYKGITPIAAHPAFRKTKCLFYVLHFRSHYSLFLSYNRSWGRGWDPVKLV